MIFGEIITSRVLKTIKILNIRTTQQQNMEYNKIEVDGNGNIILQDITGGAVTINYNDSESLSQLMEQLTNKQIFELKESIGNQNKQVLEEIRKMQKTLDERFVEKKSHEQTKDLDAFFKQLKEMKMEGLKKRILTNYDLLREYEELYILEDDPKRKMCHEMEIEKIKDSISKQETELINMK